MGKHSSSSSSSSDSSDDEQKRWKKQQKRQRKLQKYGPQYYENKPHKKGKKKDKHGGYGVPGQFAVGHGANNPYAGYPQAGGYPGGPGAYPPPGQPGYPNPGMGGYPNPGVQPYPGTGAPAFSAPGAPGYPPQPGYPAPGGGGLGFADPSPGGFSVPPGYGAPPPAGGLGFGADPGYPSQPGYGAPPGGAYPGQQQPGYPASQPPAAGYPGAPGGYGAPPAVQGYPGAQGGYQQPPPQQPGYGAPPSQQPGYGAPPGGQPPYQQQPGGQPPYQQQPGGQPGYQQPPGGQPGYQQQAPPQQGYQQPPAQQPPQGQGQPPAQQAPPPRPADAPSQAAAAHLAQDFSKMSTMGTAEKFEGVIKPASPFDAEKDCEVLRKAMKGAGTDEQAIIEIVRNRSNAQRQQIKKLFKTMYGKDLIKDLQGELSGNFREAIMALFEATTYYDAWTLNNAMMGLGTKEAPLIEVLCTRTNAEILEIVKCYKEHFRRNLEKDIVDDTSGHFKRLLVSCCQGNRAELTPAQWNEVFTKGPESVVDRELAKREAAELYKAGEKKIGTDESAFLKIMALRHFYQLRATFEEYAKISQRDILNSIGREMSGDLESGFKALVMSARNRPEYFADKLYKSMKGAGTNDSTLIRIVVSRSEIDLKQIKAVFFQKYQKTLAKFIEQDTSGDYKKMLVGIVGYDW